MSDIPGVTEGTISLHTHPHIHKIPEVELSAVHFYGESSDIICLVQQFSNPAIFFLFFK